MDMPFSQPSVLCRAIDTQRKIAHPALLIAHEAVTGGKVTVG
jgi:hypothetical protein